MNEHELDFKIGLLKKILADTRGFVDNEIRDARKYSWRRTWLTILTNLPLFLSGCLDFYKLHYGLGIATMLAVEGFVAFQWVMWNACLKRSRHWKKKWSQCHLEGADILKKMEEYRERGFE